MKLETRIYGWLLRVYPKDFRQNFETEMLQVFRLSHENAQLERWTLMFWVVTVFDCLSSATRERFFRKGESMNWLRNVAIFFCLLFALEILVALTSDVFHFHNPFGIILPSPLEKPILIFGIVGFLVIHVGIFLSLPLIKNRMEWFGIITFFIIFIYSSLPNFFENTFPFSTNKNIIIWFYFLIFALSLFSIIFARVKFKFSRLDLLEVPIISKILVIYLISIFIPQIIIYLTDTSNNLTSFDLFISDIMNLLQYLALAFGIWISKPIQTTQIPKLISS